MDIQKTRETVSGCVDYTVATDRYGNQTGAFTKVVPNYCNATQRREKRQEIKALWHACVTQAQQQTLQHPFQIGKGYIQQNACRNFFL